MANKMYGIPYSNASLHHMNSHIMPDCTMLNMAAQNAAQMIFGSCGSGMNVGNSGCVLDWNFDWNDGGIDDLSGGAIRKNMGHNIGGNTGRCHGGNVGRHNGGGV
eukprot:4781486-Ditylum_brightwellii.AAC.1